MVRLFFSDLGTETAAADAVGTLRDHWARWVHVIGVPPPGDGGFHFSYDGGDTWEFRNQVPLAQFYQISADMNDPYTVCGGLQDNDAWTFFSELGDLVVTGPTDTNVNDFRAIYVEQQR